MEAVKVAVAAVRVVVVGVMMVVVVWKEWRW